jgi:hypothetical protein
MDDNLDEFFLVLEGLNKKSFWHVYCMGEHWLPKEFSIPIITQVEKIYKEKKKKRRKEKKIFQKNLFKR